MTDKERFRKELERQKAQWRICKSSEAKYRLEMLEELLSFIDSIDSVQLDQEISNVVDRHWWEMLGEEPVSDSLEEAANTYVDNWYKLNNIDKESYPIDVEISKNDFKAGAKWQKQQLLKDALDGYVTLTMTGVRTVAATIPDGKCGFDDKIKLVIIKED